MPESSWSVLVYKVPSQPTRLRIQIWRKLQALGAVYLQDGMAILPTREDLDENLGYLASAIDGMGGSAVLLRSKGFSPEDDQQIVLRFQQAADARMEKILSRLKSVVWPEIDSYEALGELEDALKRERLAYLKARRLCYFSSSVEPSVEAELERWKIRLERLIRGNK